MKTITTHTQKPNLRDPKHKPHKENKIKFLQTCDKEKVFKVAIKNRCIIYSETKIMTTDFPLERMQVRR